MISFSDGAYMDWSYAGCSDPAPKCIHVPNRWADFGCREAYGVQEDGKEPLRPKRGFGAWFSTSSLKTIPYSNEYMNKADETII